MKRPVIVLVAWIVLLNLAGCEAFTRKFTRKSKKTDQTVEMVLAPEEYKGPNMTKEELYRQYFLYWKSWQDELIEALLYSVNRKKPIDSANEAIKNLEQLRTMLNEEKKKRLDTYMNQLKNLKEAIVQDTYGANSSSYRVTAEQIKRAILRDFSYIKVKNGLL